MSRPIGERIGSPHFVHSLSGAVTGAFSRAAARGPLQGRHGDLDTIAMSTDQWDMLRADLDEVLEKYLTIVADATEQGVERLRAERDEADRHAGVLSRRLAALGERA